MIAQIKFALAQKSSEQEKVDFLQQIGYHINQQLALIQSKHQVPFADVVSDQPEPQEADNANA